MANRPIEFLVPETRSAPGSLLESIRRVDNLSAGFCRNWLSKEISDANFTSQEAFQFLDHIQNEILRHRDEKSKLSSWKSDPFKMALESVVGDLINPATKEDKEFFVSCSPGAGALPASAVKTSLTLAEALNKLKHRSTSSVNFTVSPTGTHVLYIFTNAGMGKQDTISTFDVNVFCKLCKVAAAAI